MSTVVSKVNQTGFSPWECHWMSHTLTYLSFFGWCMFVCMFYCYQRGFISCWVCFHFSVPWEEWRLSKKLAFHHKQSCFYASAVRFSVKALIAFFFYFLFFMCLMYWLNDLYAIQQSAAELISLVNMRGKTPKLVLFSNDQFLLVLKSLLCNKGCWHRAHGLFGGSFQTGKQGSELMNN